MGWWSAGVRNLDLRFRAGINSLNHCDKVALTMDCALVYRLRWSNTSTPSIEGTTVDWLPNKNDWVLSPLDRTSRSFGALWDVRSVCIQLGNKVVFKNSSLRRSEQRMIKSTILKLQAKLFQMSLWYGELGRLKYHLRPLPANSAATLSSFHFSMQSRRSLSVPMKIVLSSDQITAGKSQQVAKRSTPITHELVFVDGKTWTANLRQVKRIRHLLSSTQTDGNIKCSKVIKPGVSKVRRLACKSLDWEICHGCFTGCRT